MIIMTCGFCGCRDLIPANVHYETMCPDCLVQLSLWEVRMVQIESTPQLLVTEELEAIGLNLAQLDEK
jgi:hypothetical protein